MPMPVPVVIIPRPVVPMIVAIVVSVPPIWTVVPAVIIVAVGGIIPVVWVVIIVIIRVVVSGTIVDWKRKR
jgi:hypothetical protein